jgi:hypothetical protein
MRAISIGGFDPSTSIGAGATPSLRWLPIGDLLVDPAYQRSIDGRGRAIIRRIARSFLWSCFAPVVVAPVAGGKFAIIDGQRRTTAAALAGFESVPCQLVTADRDEQAIARKAITGVVRSNSRMEAHAAGLTVSEPCAVRLSEVCARAGVELLRYPVPVNRQTPGQTMAIAAVAQCLERYGQETLITALQCVTQTNNNRRGVLNGRMIKSLCAVLNSDHERRDSGLTLLDAFDSIDLLALQRTASIEAARKKISPTQAVSHHIRRELDRAFRKNFVGMRQANSPTSRLFAEDAALLQLGRKVSERAARQSRKS